MPMLPYLLLGVCVVLLLRTPTASTSTGNAAQSRLLPAPSHRHFMMDCGSRLVRRQPRTPTHPQAAAGQVEGASEGGMRTPRIIAGLPTKEGQFPWQASLELLHPSLGFLGHWCGAVLIHQQWVLSAAHCVHNDLFNLPIPPLWTVVLGEHNRLVETGDEQRIPVEKIVLHKNYHNFLNDLVLMKLSKPADLSERSSVRRICLPFPFNDYPKLDELDELDDEAAEDSLEDILGESDEEQPDHDPLEPGLAIVHEKFDNFLRSVQHLRRPHNLTMPSMRDLMSLKIVNLLRQVAVPLHPEPKSERHLRPQRRRNDKLMRIAEPSERKHHPHPHPNSHSHTHSQQHHRKHHHPHRHSQQNQQQQDFMELPFIDCIATGWGKWNVSGDLTHLLLKTRVPLHNNGRCREAYGSFVEIHHGHLCAGKLNGKGGTCVGDSGGPLQCRLSKGGPWILAGITSFGSGCAVAGFPDVYTRTSYYMKWIQDTISYE